MTPVGKAVGWGILGCGDVVDRKAAAALRTIPGSSIVAVMRRSAEEARKFSERHAGASWTTDAGAVIGDSRVNAIYIATPPEHHLEYALAVCAAGKACLVEKPAGRSEHECRQMVEAFRRTGVPLYVSYYRRHLAKFRRVKEILASGELGTIVAIHYRLAKPTDADDWRVTPSASGGGRFYDLAGHVLDLFDDWFGPLEFLGSAAANLLPIHAVEDAVTLVFRTAGGAIGHAAWNFAAPSHVDELVIEGLGGSLRLTGMSRSGSLWMQQTSEAAIRMSRSLNQRVVRQVKERLHLPTWRRFRFAGEPQPHRPMLERIVAELGAGTAPASPSAALRTSAIMNKALEEYYGGRDGAFWERPARWQNLRQQAAARTAATAAYRLNREEVEFFAINGYLGPLKCDGDWQRLVVPVKKGRNLHLTEPFVFDLCTHPSIVRRAAQLLGQDQVALFKSRFVVKEAGSSVDVAWHQDVGPTNGGYFPDGRPVPTLSCWLALDRVNASNGAMQVIPGSQQRLVGDFHTRIRAELLERGEITEAELATAVTFALEPGEFYLFHSWLLHGSEANASAKRRAGLNMRYVAVDHEYEDDIEYFPLDCSGASAAR